MSFDSNSLSEIIPDPERRPEWPSEVLAPLPPEQTALEPVRVTNRADEAPPWTGWDIVGLAVFGLAALLLASLLVIGSAKFTPAYRNATLAELATDPKLVIIATGFGYVALLGLMLALVRRHSTSFAQGIRWNWPHARWFWFVFIGIGLAIIIQPLSSLLPTPKTLPIDRMFRDAESAWLMTIFGTLCAPLVEEIFFRGFLYPVLTRWSALLVVAILDVLGGIVALLFSAVTHNNLAFWIGLGLVLGAGVIGTLWLFSLASGRIASALAIVVTAILFAFVHEQQLAAAWAPLLMVFIVGLVLTLVRARTKSVASSVLVHMAYNATLFTMFYFASDHFRHLERVT